MKAEKVPGISHMKRYILLLIGLALATSAEARDLQLLNAEVLGKSTRSAVTLLRDKRGNEIEPIVVMVDVEKGTYIAATVLYPREASFHEARASLNRLYATYENKDILIPDSMAVWRNRDKEFSIQLTRDEEFIGIIYIAFGARRSR
jgi:hypothetical protein